MYKNAKWPGMDLEWPSGLKGSSVKLLKVVKWSDWSIDWSCHSCQVVEGAKWSSGQIAKKSSGQRG